MLVDVDLTDDQKLFVETSVHWMQATYPLQTVRKHIGSGADPGPDYRRQAAALGWFSMCVPEELNGGSVSGNGTVDLALVAHARGALVQPGPFVGTNVVAFALARGGTANQQAKLLPGLLDGEASAAWAFTGPGENRAPWAGVQASDTADGYQLTGLKTLVEDADRCEWILVTASSDGGPIQALVSTTTPGLTFHPLDSLDLTRRFCEVRFEAVEVPRADLVGAASPVDLIDQQLSLACVLTAAESVGTMDSDFELAVQYAKDRIAFGRPIGSFQAIKHLLADTSLMLEMSKAVVMAAARALGEDQPEAAKTASMAKAFVGDCGVELAQNCLQVFGGIGQTWEYDQHFFLRRLNTDIALYGNPDWHRERLCELSGL